MKTNYLNIAIGVMGLLIMVAGFIFLQAGQARSQASTISPQAVDSSVRTITVTGSGEAAGSPDQAVIRMGVYTDAMTAAEALSQNNQQMKGLIDVFKGAGVDAADIQTRSIQIWPRYAEQPAQESGSRELLGYTASNIIEVRLRRLEQIGSLLDDAVAAGGNTIESISFEIGDRNPLVEDARKAAMEDARQKAEQLASLGGGKLGPVQSINEEGGAPPVPFSPPRGMVAAGGQAVPIEPGSQTVSLSVQVTWILE